jgi:GNAT superfamily N-acetyltransferase
MKYEACEFAELVTFEAYLASLSSPIDSFLEGHILESQAYRILKDETEIGSFTVHKGTLLTQFHLVGPSRRLGQNVLPDLIARFGITTAFVPTCDEFFLSHAVDAYSDLKKQAYFFMDGGSVLPPAVFSELDYRPARPSDLDVIKATHDDFLEDPEEILALGQLHVGFLNQELAAIGIIEKSRLFRQHASIGMFTRETHRHKGIGTSTILYLKEACRNEGIVPIAGCWYYNHLSKKTLEAAGMYTATRLLRFEFADQAKE